MIPTSYGPTSHEKQRNEWRLGAAPPLLKGQEVFILYSEDSVLALVDIFSGSWLWKHLENTELH